MADTSKQGLTPDLELAQKYLTLLDESAEQVTFQLYHDYNSQKAAMKLHGSLSHYSKILADKNQAGYSICVTVNETDGRGRKKENIIRARAIWRENDKPGLPELPDAPHIVIETSPGHRHEYFLVDDCPLDEWRSVQQRLVDDYGSDPGAKDLPRVLRVPGFYHQKDPANPFMVQIVNSSSAPPIPWARVKEIFPPVEKPTAKQSPESDPSDCKSRNPEEVISAINSLDPDLEYPEWLSIGMALHDCFDGHLEGLKIWREWSRTGEKYQDGDCDDRWKGFISNDENRVKIETLFKLASDTGWRWKATGSGGPKIVKLKSNRKKAESSNTDDGQDAEDTENQDLSMAAQVIKMANRHITLYHDGDNTGYVVIEVDGRRELWPIESAYFKQWLGQLLYKQGLILNRNTWTDVQNVLLGRAIFDGSKVSVHVRTAFVDGSYYLDLCRDDWSIVKIEPGQWNIASAVEGVFFRRTSAMRALPTPKSCDYPNLPALLQEHLNMDEANIRLLIGYLVECLMNDTEYPILELTGSPGSGKSTVQEMIREIIDPNKVNLRAAPKTVEDVFVSAHNNHLVSYNNLSKISKGMSDALCSLSTGGGHAGRKFYTNTDEIAVDIQRPVAMNGISCLAKQSDLIDRLIRITLQPIDSKRNRAKKQVMDSFKKDLPQILGSLLNCLCTVLEVLPEVKLDRLPRMADFARTCQALTEIYGWEPALLDIYYNNRSVSFEETLETSPAVMAVVKVIQRDGIFEGTIKSLFDAIQPSSTDNWVKTYRGLSEKLRTFIPALKAIGIEMWFDPVRKNDGYHVMIKDLGKQRSQRSPRSPDQAGSKARKVWESEHGEHGEHHSQTPSRIDGDSAQYEETI